VQDRVNLLLLAVLDALTLIAIVEQVRRWVPILPGVNGKCIAKLRKHFIVRRSVRYNDIRAECFDISDDSAGLGGQAVEDICAAAILLHVRGRNCYVMTATG
jgi:hypothetical protein